MKNILNKVYTIDTGKKISSKQLPVDPFGRQYGAYGLVQPPYSLEQLIELRESNPLHQASIEQKASDVAGLGWKWVAKPEIQKPSKEQQLFLQDFLENCNPEYTFREMLQVCWDDFETTGWCAIEIVRNAKGELVELYHVPAHTLRAHNDGVKFAQWREGRIRWFKQLGIEKEFDMETGKEVNGLALENQAGELLVIRKLVSRSNFYGIPGYISALGALIGSTALRDYNINFFLEKTIPDYVLVIEGADVSKEVQEELRAFFNIEAKGKHHKLCILPIPAEMAGEVTAKFEKLTNEVKEASFRLYRQDNALEICIAHRMPPMRIGWPIAGMLAGSPVKEMLKTYKNGVIEPGQEILEHRLNQQLFKTFYNGKLEWKFKLNDIDLDDQVADMEYCLKGISGGIMTPNQVRKHFGWEPYLEGNGFYIASSLVSVGQEVIEKAEKKVDYLEVHGKHEKKLQNAVVNFSEHKKGRC